MNSSRHSPSYEENDTLNPMLGKTDDLKDSIPTFPAERPLMMANERKDGGGPSKSHNNGDNKNEVDDENHESITKVPLTKTTQQQTKKRGAEAVETKPLEMGGATRIRLQYYYGGYASQPLPQQEGNRNGWLSAEETDEEDSDLESTARSSYNPIE